MSNRFYLDPHVSSLDGNLATIRGDEAHHFSRVMRGRQGDEIYLFDGRGISYRCVVQALRKDALEAHVLEKLHDEIESPLRLTIATALPKGDRQRFLVEKLAELGVARLVPLRLERSVARANEGSVAKFRRYVIEAAKQCGRNVLMEVTEELSPDEWNRQLDAEGDFTKYILHPISLGEVGQTTPRHILHGNISGRIALLVGPEGSFTEKEVQTALENDFKPLELGKRILRTETACIAAASLLLTYAG